MPYLASAAKNRISHCSASVRPRPIAWPLTAAITGLASVHAGTGNPAALNPSPGVVKVCVPAPRSAPAQNAGGVPVSGRVMAVLILATDAMEPVGFLIGVGLAAVFPLAVPTVLFGALCVVVSGWTLLSVLRRPLPGPVGHQSAV